MANLSINGFSDFSTINMLALSDASGAIEMELSQSNFGDHRIRARSIEVSFGEEIERIYTAVPALTLDEYAKFISSDWSEALVWIDTQGHEGSIFLGGKDFLESKNGPKFIVTEFWPYGIERAAGKDDYFNFLNKCSFIYDLNNIIEGQFKRVWITDLDQMYINMLGDTKKEHHPHTDLLLILSGG